jgi:oxygen-dependent protoporphyrinogen oxidase
MADPASAAPLRLVVIGGGITGLSAAHAALARASELGRAVEVTVLERAPRFGGNLLTERVDGFLLDGGPDSWVVTKPQASALAKELGLGASLVGTNPAHRRYFVAHGGQLHAVPEGLVLGVPTQLVPLARTRLFSWSGKLRMALEPFVRARRHDGADGDESIADFATRRLGREAAERLVAPLLGGISSGDAQDLSILAAFPQLAAMEEEHGSLVRGMRSAAKARRAAEKATGGQAIAGSAFVSLAGGTGALVEALVTKLRETGARLRPGESVDAVERTGAGWSVRLGSGEMLGADAVLVAVPAYVAARICGAVDAQVAESLSAVAYGSTATVFVGYRRDRVTHPLDGVGFVVPRSARRPILASTWVSSKWEGRAPEGRVLVRAFFGGAWGEEILARTDDELVAVTRDELRTLMGIDAEPVMAKVFRFDRKSPQMRVGHVTRMRELQERLALVAPGLRIAGGGYDGVGIPDCVRQGQEAARAFVRP